MTGQDQLPRMQTYIQSVDDILHGGIPRYSVTVVTGGPGSGKTVFTLQTMFNNARQGEKCIYLTTLSEPATKLIRYTQRFDFFDEGLVDDKIKFMDIGTALRTGGPQNAYEEIIRIVEEEQPSILAIDSYKAIHDLAPGPDTARLFTYDIAAFLAGWSVTSFLVGEYTLDEVKTNPEFAVADVIIRLAREVERLRGLREIEVIKLRGSGYNDGRHFYEISQAGLRAYPRVGTVEEEEYIKPEMRIPSGISGLDELLEGGLLETSSTLLEGTTGVGKTLLGLHFMARGTKRGEKGIVFALEERPSQLRDVAAGVGINLGEGSGIQIHYTNPVELLGAKWLESARNLISQQGVKRVMIDSLSSMRLGIVDQDRFYDLIYTAIKMFRSAGCTLIMTLELAENAGAISAASGLSAITDNIILMRYVEIESRLKRAITVLKTRGSSHDSELREFAISSQGISVIGPFKEFRGVLTGVPTPVAS